MKKVSIFLLITSLLFTTLANEWEGDYTISFHSEGYDLELYVYVYQTAEGYRAQCSGMGHMYSREMLMKGVVENKELKLYYIRDNFPGLKDAFEQFTGKVMLQFANNPLQLTAYDDYLISFEEGEREEVSIIKDSGGVEYKKKRAVK